MKIAALGSAPSSVQLAPFKNSNFAAWVEGKVQSMAVAHGQVPGDFEIWGCSPAAWSVAPRATRWFEVHRWEPGREWFSPEYCDFLRRFTGPVYTGAVVPEIPNHVVYPIDRIEEKFSSYFLTSSLALILALAIDTIEEIRAARRAWREANAKLDAGVPNPNGVNPLPAFVNADELDKSDDDDLIGMWGVDMAATEEYGYQRPGCQFFILEAMRRGIGVYLPAESDLMRPQPVYGISEWDHNYIKLTARARELAQKRGIALQQMEEARSSLQHAEGGMGELNAFVNTWTSPYGMQHGMVIRQTPGTGLGSGITHFDGRPVSRMTVSAPAAPEAKVVQAMADTPEAQLGRELSVALEDYRRQVGAPLEAPAALMRRLIGEAALARTHSELLQGHCLGHEGTLETMRRIISERDAALAPKRKRRR